MSILSCFRQKDQLPKKVARLEEETVEKAAVDAVDEAVEDTVEEAVEETVEETARVSVEDEAVEETVEDTIEETVVKPLEKGNKRGISGAATYRCSFKKEWSARWPFITMGTTSSFYWCSVCRQENSCAHQGVRDISRHVEGKGHRAKEQALNSASSVAHFYTPATSVGGMSVQEAKMTKFIMKLFARFMKPLALQGRKVHDILYKDPLNQLTGDKLHVGFTTRATLNRLLEAGDITPQEVQLFQQAALVFLVRAVEYSISKLPLKEALLKHAKFVDVQQRAECGVEDALYFELLPFHGPQEQDKVGDEFLEYQLMDIPMPQDPTTFNLEEFWGSMSSTKNKERRHNESGSINLNAEVVDTSGLCRKTTTANEDYLLMHKLRTLEHTSGSQLGLCLDTERA
ncbi:unnamed protein product [Merluccius merluccius]